MNKFSEKRTGDITEITACNLLLKEGYEVFRNLCCTGAVDIVAIKDNKVYLIDVKTPNIYKGKFTHEKFYYSKLTPIQKELGVILLGVYKNKLHWKESDDE
tara:strand:+ start:1979 stop:2281 length:303 start_codon:yes stop_codon:yes gene_type:complete